MVAFMGDETCRLIAATPQFFQIYAQNTPGPNG